MINLINLSPWPLGGSTSYTVHLYHAMVSRDIDVQVLKLGNRTEEFTRNMGKHQVPYRNLCMQDLIKEVKNNPSLMTAACPEKQLKVAGAIETLIKHGMRCVIHDPNEFKIYPHAHLIDNPVLIRSSMLKHFPKGTFIPHPYNRRYDFTVPEKKRRVAGSLARVTFCKHTDIVLEANRKLAKKLRVDLLANVNRLYAHSVLQKKYPEFDMREYKGMPKELHAQPETILPYRFSVDLTSFHHIEDGGGTSYSIMEAIDGGAVNILHREWTRYRGVMQETKNCLAIDSPEELRTLLRLYNTSEVFKEECQAISVKAIRDLRKNNPAKVVPRYIEELES